MVRNVAKFLAERIVYHSTISIEQFFFYDNDSEDDLYSMVDRLALDGTVERHKSLVRLDAVHDSLVNSVHHFGLKIGFKTKWIGGSIARVYHYKYQAWEEFKVKFGRRVSAYMVDWTEMVNPRSKDRTPSLGFEPKGWATWFCEVNDMRLRDVNRRWFGVEGSNGDYRMSLVRLDAVHYLLVNSVHHFGLKIGFKMKWIEGSIARVYHYKYQAWEEFKVKFGRRVSAYMVDWTKMVNPRSKDRTPSLGFEPKGWATWFCEVNDMRLRDVNRRWFGVEGSNGDYRMVWEWDGNREGRKRMR
uniref:Glycosyltransferase family 92 protein n=1 Tax=Elaeis guineensis var. tenera TaxID=51953 RepID=A0A8N4IBI5_ELAGV|nr:glycosyltransferase family 92 protein RCOM_0530710-like [Elaeis guineensis]